MLAQALGCGSHLSGCRQPIHGLAQRTLDAGHEVVLLLYAGVGLALLHILLPKEQELLVHFGRLDRAPLSAAVQTVIVESKVTEFRIRITIFIVPVQVYKDICLMGHSNKYRINNRPVNTATKAKNTQNTHNVLLSQH